MKTKNLLLIEKKYLQWKKYKMFFQEIKNNNWLSDIHYISDKENIYIRFNYDNFLPLVFYNKIRNIVWYNFYSFYKTNNELWVLKTNNSYDDLSNNKILNIIIPNIEFIKTSILKYNKKRLRNKIIKKDIVFYLLFNKYTKNSKKQQNTIKELLR
jgi:hypothetical protein